MTTKKTNYALLRFMGKFLVIFNSFLAVMVILMWLFSFFFRATQPFAPIMAIPFFGIAFGEICRAVADIADRQ